MSELGIIINQRGKPKILPCKFILNHRQNEFGAIHLFKITKKTTTAHQLIIWC